jgi:NADH-quinone oxidoreductase subunit G
MVPGYLPGRVRRTDGAAAWSEVWSTTPGADGLDTEGILRASADGKIQTLVLLGADPMVDFVDGDLARRGLDGAGTVIAVDQFLTASSSCADIVLPAAGAGEVDGTFTNLEGRISTVRAKVTPPGMAWSDWMIAAELARRLDSPFADDVTADSLWAEVVAASPLHADADLPVIESSPEGILLSGDAAAAPGPVAEPDLPSRDQWTYRLVVTHRLYDQGTLLQHCVSSAGLATESFVALSPLDLDTLGVSDGGKVKVTSAEGTVTAVAVADRGLPRGSVGLIANVGAATANQLIDASAPVTDVQVETV